MNSKEISIEAFDSFFDNLKRQNGGIMTGFTRLDNATGGLRAGTMFIVGARPSTGKTTFALNIACNQFLVSNDTVMIFSLEMSSQMILERILSAENNIDYKKFSLKSFSKAEKEEMQKTLDRLKEKFIIIDNLYGAEEIAEKIKEYKPKLAIVDFVQCVTTEKFFENPRIKIDYISNLFKRTAKGTNSVIMVLSQITRQGKDAPTMSDLKESGALEQDGDYIALLHRDYVIDKRSGHPPSDAVLILDKNKFGATGQMKMTFDLQHQKFHEVKKY